MNFRLYFRLITAYIAAHRFYFLLGLAISLLAVAFSPQLSNLLSRNRRPRAIGLAGNYTISSLPSQVQNLISLGLTKLEPDGQATGAAAIFWEATDSGKRITFTLRSDLKWQDNEEFHASQVNYNLKSVDLTRPSPNKVTFIFQEPFAPLLAILTQPLFKNGLVGLGEYVVESVKFNGRFVSQVNLQSHKTNQRVVYKFYPTEENLMTALKLGAVDEIQDLHQISRLPNDGHYRVQENIAKHTVATLFYNTQKPPLDEKQVRQALTYALPDSFAEGERTSAPVPQDSWFSGNFVKKYPQSLKVAGNILDRVASGAARPKLTIQTNKPLAPVASQIAAFWKQIGVETGVQITDIVPTNYDVYLAYLELPADPDQYTLWHSTQQGNISRYKSPKIDKLLEEGRRTLNLADRLEIYSDFQKAITEDIPAAFLFYPKVYTVSRK